MDYTADIAREDEMCKKENIISRPKFKFTFNELMELTSLQENTKNTIWWQKVITTNGNTSNYIDWKVLRLSKGLGYLREPSQHEKKLNTNERLYGK